ncbi:MarR family winged helix-turn-helix transcriptional regulator [Vibrio gazogenes]|uniref:DNA-binding transcriptional regulator, MarR family n=1 Tax=Vibrio gazogenes DSM 21264 = NBRC 103151 TaxID=1123492 RepID=A0A1M4X5L3_VIBGA|nr:MarR family transcriptional regulator [Vibrio gazogenes]USP13015.1 MarR family transcriptional regulator [Vibrio gazogenes]SHE88735.1 DNA-binding transcriptional regulator, MarR family [Vibrio gazogenes DSM 21264] [Vibrio gazogenes DSM 21264 = NBRC 103151]SJN57332.1 HTH-type transcriptional regulator MhqR [Vibrio gazogenes]
MDIIDRIVNQWAAEKPELNTLPMSIFGRILHLAKHLEQEIANIHKRYDLKSGEFDVLATLLRSGAPYQLTPSALISTAMLTSGAMTNRLDKLEQKNLITRIHSNIDRRSISVQLTEQGYQLINQALAEHVQAQERLISVLNQTEQSQLSTLLKSWLSSFDPSTPSGSDIE